MAGEGKAAGNSSLADQPSPPSTASGGGRTVLNGIGAHLYLEDVDGKVVLGLRHPDSAYAGSRWHFLAGHCEQESAVTCLIREAQEEAGLLIKPGDIELAHVVHLVDTPGGRPRMQMVFRAHRWTGTPVIQEPDKCTSWHWRPPDGLPAQTVPYTRAAIEGICAGRLYTEMGWS
ncbi:NUDIX hydrolase [Streptomyces sp. NPDC001739]